MNWFKPVSLSQVATIIALALAGAIAGGFVVSSAEEERNALQTELDKVNAQIDTLQTSYAANQKKVDALCSSNLRMAFLDLDGVERKVGELGTGTDNNKAFKEAMEALIVRARRLSRSNSENRCLNTNSSSK